MIASGTCPECGTKVGSDHGVDPYKHCIGCLGLPAARPADMVAIAMRQSAERGKRVKLLLDMA